MTSTTKCSFVKIWSVLTVCLALLSMPLEGTPQEKKKKKKKSETRSEQRIVFPLAPGEPVIEWVGAYQRPTDVKAKKRKLQKILVGEVEDELLLLAPTALAIGPDETLYVVDQRLKAVIIINAAERRFEAFTGAGSALLRDPVGVAVASDGTLYVSDGSAQTVFVYNPDLTFKMGFGGQGVLNRPTGIALSYDDGRLAICDTRVNKVIIMDTSSGKILTTIGREEQSSKEGEFHWPVAVAFDREGYLYVSDYLNFRFQIFDPAGDFDSAFGRAGDRPGTFSRPRGIAVDSEHGVIFEVDGTFEVVQMFNLDGELLMWFGSPGDGASQFSLPSGIARRGDLVAVADTMNHRVQIFRFLGPPPPPES